jgi:hypothetical protein
MSALILPVVCIARDCGRTYKEIPVNNPLAFPDGKIAGICPECQKKLDDRLFTFGSRGVTTAEKVREEIHV